MSKNKFLEVIEVNDKFYIGSKKPLIIYGVKEFNTRKEATVVLLSGTCMCRSIEDMLTKPLGDNNNGST